MGVRDWYVPFTADAPARLFAFPHAGAGTVSLSRLAKATLPDVAVWAANLPGRQARVGEPPVTELEPLVDELTEWLTELVRPPYGLFGYCGGALLAFLVARALRDRGAPDPEALVVASFEAPDIAYRPEDLAVLPSERLWARLSADGGVDADLVADDRVRHLVEPAVRVDLGILGGYRHTVAPPLPYPIVVCFGTRDPTPRGAWLGWPRQSDRPVRLRALPGGHWLLDECAGELATVLVEAVTGRSG